MNSPHDAKHTTASLVTSMDVASALLDELRELGRYAEDVSPEDLEADRLRLALALMRTRRAGFEDGVAVHAWWSDAVDGLRMRERPAIEEKPR